MSEGYRSAQGTIVPSIFIGMGGTGSRIVDRIAMRAQRLANWASQLEPLTSFVAIDTNDLDLKKLAEIPPANKICISGFSKREVINGWKAAQNTQVFDWLNIGYEPRGDTTPGAGQIRVESRVGFFYMSPMIRDRLTAVVNDTLKAGVTWRSTDQKRYHVYLFSTLAGGTGSGSFLSMAYLVQSVIRGIGWQPRIIGNLLLSTLMLDKVRPELHHDIHANTYAALKELEHLTKLDYPQVHQEGRTSEPFAFARDDNSPEITQVKDRPFFLSFLLDKPQHIALPDTEGTIGDSAFLQIFTPIIDNLASELDNYEKTQRELTRYPGDLRSVGLGYTKNCGAFGAAALIVPGADLLDYCSLRFAAEAIRSQITFGLDRAADDDRARKLAKLAVDYADPKFQRMSQEARERAINKSFVDSVRELARQDEREELTEGYWLQLVELTDSGRKSGVTPEGQVLRGESLLARIARDLETRRNALLNKVSIKERAFAFHREGVNQYIEYVGRLIEDIRQSRTIVEEGIKGLEMSGAEGEAVQDLKLDPIAERYVVLRLLDECEQKWIPEADAQQKAAKDRDVSKSSVKDRLEKEVYQSLQEAAAKKSLFKGDQAFLAAREEAQEYYRTVSAAARKFFEADVRLRQLRALLDYLSRRASQRSRLASQMETQVVDLEAEAERLRRGEIHRVLPFALRVEVFETLDRPAVRIWDRVYRALYVDDGRYLSTFDRGALAMTIASELKQEVAADGRIVEKSVDKTVYDVRKALINLGRDRLTARIMGSSDDTGLDLARALNLEAVILLKTGKPPGFEPSQDDVGAYGKKKMKNFAQLAGVTARVSSAEAQAWDEGVKVSRTRQLIIGTRSARRDAISAVFENDLKEALTGDGRTVQVDVWHDPQLAIVHDVELPIPMYYVRPVVGEIEDAYLKLAKDESRPYDLHTSDKWEHALANLNPRRSEITIGWSIRMLVEGLLAKIMSLRNGLWVWQMDGDGKTFDLGKNLSKVLYQMGEIHRSEHFRMRLETAITAATKDMTPEVLAERCGQLQKWIYKRLDDMEIDKLKGQLSAEGTLDRPILRALSGMVKSRSGEASSAADERASVSLELT